MNAGAQRDLLATACHILYRLGLSDYLGHPGVRLDAERVLIKPKHSPRIRGMDRMHADDMVVIDLAGRLVEGVHEPPAERFIHTEIYRARPDVWSGKARLRQRQTGDGAGTLLVTE